MLLLICCYGGAVYSVRCKFYILFEFSYVTRMFCLKLTSILNCNLKQLLAFSYIFIVVVVRTGYTCFRSTDEHFKTLRIKIVADK